MFETASKLKLRYATTKGNITTEDLWNMPLTSSTQMTSLDDLARALRKELEESGEESFVFKKTKTDKTLQLKFEIVKEVINQKLEEAKQKENAQVKKKRKEFLLSLAADIQEADDRNMSLKDIKKELKTL